MAARTLFQRNFSTNDLRFIHERDLGIKRDDTPSGDERREAGPQRGRPNAPSRDVGQYVRETRNLCRFTPDSSASGYSVETVVASGGSAETLEPNRGASICART